MGTVLRSTATVATALALVAAGAPGASAAPPAKQPTLSISDATVVEGTGGRTPMTFTVSLSAPSSRTVTVDVGTVDGSGTSGTDDYVRALQTLVFAKGETSKAVVVEVVGDALDEPDETFSVDLSRATEAVVRDGVGLGTIVDDDEPPAQTLTVTRAGSGTGTVSSTPAGIDCGSDCSEAFPAGTPVSLTAAPDAGSTYTGWSGDCSGTGACQVTMDAARSVTATFAAVPQEVTLSVSCLVTKGTSFGGACDIAGDGTAVTSADGGITCGADCTQAYTAGTTVTLSAVDGSTYSFDTWSGACAAQGSNPTCTLVLQEDTQVGAVFRSAPAPTPAALTVQCSVSTQIGDFPCNGAGVQVSSADGGISCPGDCEQTYTVGQTVVLTATGSALAAFTGWGGACSSFGTQPTCTLVLQGSTQADAAFQSVLG